MCSPSLTDSCYIKTATERSAASSTHARVGLQGQIEEFGLPTCSQNEVIRIGRSWSIVLIKRDLFSTHVENVLIIMFRVHTFCSSLNTFTTKQNSLAFSSSLQLRM